MVLLDENQQRRFFRWKLPWIANQFTWNEIIVCREVGHPCQSIWNVYDPFNVFERTVLNIVAESSSVNLQQTRMHSRRMLTARLETVHVSVSVATISCFGERVGVGPEMNKFEQVSNDHHQMPLAAEGEWSPDLMPRSYPTIWPIPWCIWCYLSPRGQTDACENITFPQLHLRAVKTRPQFIKTACEPRNLGMLSIFKVYPLVFHYADYQSIQRRVQISDNAFCQMGPIAMEIK